MSDNTLYEQLAWQQERLDVVEFEVRCLQEESRNSARTVTILSIAVFFLACSIIAINFNFWGT